MSNSPPPMSFYWDGSAMIPRHVTIARRFFAEGEVVTMEVREDRSTASHRHYFAALKEAHDSLPEEIAERLPTPEALRKFCLIKAGFRDERTIACSSRAEALRLAGFIKPMDEYAVVVTSGATVTVYTAKSQSVRAMDRQTFAASKEAVLNIVASLIGTTPQTLSSNAGAAA